MIFSNITVSQISCINKRISKFSDKLINKFIKKRINNFVDKLINKFINKRMNKLEKISVLINLSINSLIWDFGKLENFEICKIPRNSKFPA